MKKIAVLCGVAIIGIVVFMQRDTLEYIQVEPIVVEKTVEVDALEEAIKSEQDSKKVQIEEVAQKAWQESFDQEMTKVEMEVRKQFGDKNNATILELEKKTGQY